MKLPDEVRILMASACEKRNVADKLMVGNDSMGALAGYLAVLAESTLALAMMAAVDMETEDDLDEDEPEPETVAGA